MNRNTLINRTLIALTLAGTLAACQSTMDASSTDTFAQNLINSDRPASDKERDVGRKPAEVVDFFGIQDGMTVLEILSSGGYYTEILSQRVGSKGKVIAQNNRFILDIFDGRFAKELDGRLANKRLNNVEHYVKEFGEFDIENQVDVVTIVLNYHDMYSNFPKAKRMKVLQQIKKSLKPGGTVGVIDMESNNGNQKDLHRISQDLVINDFADAGFKLEAKADFLKNPADDYSKVVFDKAVRGKTDRFVFKFVKA